MKKETYFCDLSGAPIPGHQPISLKVGREMNAAGSMDDIYDGVDDISFDELRMTIRQYFKGAGTDSAKDFVKIMKDRKQNMQSLQATIRG